MGRKESVIELKLRGSDKVLEDLVRLREISKGFGDEIKKTRKEMDQYKSAGKNTKQLENKIASLLKAQEKLKKGMANTRKEVREQDKAFKSAKFPKDSIIGMEQAYSKLRKQVRGLSADQRKSTFGKKLIKQSRKIKDTIRDESAAFGDTYHNVGNYQSAIENALRGQGTFSGNMKGLAMNAAKVAVPLLAVTKGVQILGAGIKDAIRITMDYEQANADLAAIMGVATEQTSALQVQSKELGGTTAFTATQTANMQIELAKLGFTQREILASGKGVINFAVATDSDIPRAASLAGSALRAFNLEATEMDRVVSVLGVSTTKSALDFGKLETGLSTVAPVANAFGFQIEGTVAFLGKLADAGFDASSSATATRNIFLKLADANGDLAKELGGNVSTFDELIEGLKTLDAKGIDLNKTLKLTDKRSVAAFNQFLKTADGALELRDSLIGVNDELQAMADKKLDTIKGRLILLKSAWEGLVLSADEGAGVISDGVSTIVEFTTQQLRLLTELNNENISFGELLTSIINPMMGEILTKSIDIAKEAEKISNNWIDIIQSGFAVDFESALVEELKFEQLQKKTEDARIEYEKLSKQLGKPIANPKKNALAFYRNQIIELKKEIGPGGPVKGSIAFIRKQISLLKKELEEEVKTDAGVKETIEEIVGYEKQLDEAENKIASIREELTREGVTETGTIDTRIKKVLEFELDKDGKEIVKILTGDIESISPKTPEVEVSFDYAQKATEDFYDLQEEKDKDRLKNRIEREKEFAEKKAAIVQGLDAIANGLLTIERNRLQYKLDDELSAAQKIYDDKVAKSGGNAVIEEEAAKELQKEKDRIEAEGAKKRKNIAYKEAIIQGALSAIEASSDPFSLALVALTTLVNLAVIANTKFAKGGFTGQALPGVAQDNTGERPVGVVHAGEYVANKENTGKYKNVFEAMETGSEEAVKRAFYEKIMKGKPYDVIYNHVPPIYPASMFMKQVDNTGIESRLEDLKDAVQKSNQKIKNDVIEGVIIGLDRGSRMLERKGYKK